MNELRGKFYIKEPGSAITHFIGMIMALIAAFPLLIKAAAQPDPVYLISMSVYAASLILLYAASTTYHTFDISEKGKHCLKKDRPYDDLRPDSRKLHACLLTCLRRPYADHFTCCCMDSRIDRYTDQSFFGYFVRNGFLPFFISEWDGRVSLHLHRFSAICLWPLSDGCLQEVLSTQSAVLFMH